MYVRVCVCVCEHPSPYRRRSQPAVRVLAEVHVAVEGVELGVAQVFPSLQQVELAPGVVIALAVPLPGEVQPLWVAKLIPCNTAEEEEEED